MKLNENQKVTLTLGQLKKLVKESGDDSRLPELKKAIREIVGFWVDDVTISSDRFTCGSLRFKVNASKATPWQAISVDKPVTIEGPLADQIAGHIVGRFIDCDKSSLERIVDLFR